MEEVKDFSKDELDALKQVARERMAYGVLTNKMKSSWVWAIGGALLAWFTFGEKIVSYLQGTVK